MIPAVSIQNLSYSYGDRHALRDVSVEVRPGELFALLGPNGSGKTTLFRIVSTLVPPAAGSVVVFGDDVATRATAIRARLGVVFQSPALDVRLTVVENLIHHGHLYGLRGRTLRRRTGEVLERLRIADRRDEIVLTLSGGLRRRTELAKALLHEPRVLVLDEPSVGLDPSARRELWSDLRELRDRQGVTVMLTTHLMDEAAGCDRVAILNEGRLVVTDTPGALIETIGGDVIWISSREPEMLAPRIRETFQTEAAVVDGRLRIERQRGHEFIPDLVEAFPGQIEAISVGKPTLEDVFIHHTGKRLE